MHGVKNKYTCTFTVVCSCKLTLFKTFQAESDIESDTSVFDVKSGQVAGGRRRSSSVVNNNNNNNGSGGVVSPEATPPLPIRSTSERTNVTTNHQS